MKTLILTLLFPLAGQAFIPSDKVAFSCDVIRLGEDETAPFMSVALVHPKKGAGLLVRTVTTDPIADVMPQVKYEALKAIEPKGDALRYESRSFAVTILSSTDLVVSVYVKNLKRGTACK